ncbi:MAG: AAA family ATPase [Desulfobulbaceae bacterium]|nr:AAA family ATPase [Desulfobulbaceae bacterium]
MEQPSMQPSPFNHGLFFPDSGRKSTLEALRNALTGSASLITCVGEEGYGKTMLSTVLENDLPESYLLISFPSSVDSFDYILQIIALKLDLTFSEENSSMGNGHLLMELSHILREQNKRLMIIIDEAEKLYLATLERIRKMIDLVNDGDVLLQIVLFGRPGLQLHLEQLALCTFRDAHEVHLTLPPLTAEDTCQYLNFCMQQDPGSERKNIFSLEVAAKILTMAQGNFRKINSLAEDSLRSSSHGTNDTSFMVLLEHVRDIDTPTAGQAPVHRMPFSFIRNKLVLAGSTLLMIFFLFLFSNRADKQKEIPVTPDVKEISTEHTAQPVISETKEQISPPVQPLPPAESATLADQPSPVPSIDTLLSQPPFSAAPETVAAPIKPEPDPSPPLPPANAAPALSNETPTAQVIVAEKLPQKNKTPLITPEPVTKNKALSPDATSKLPLKSLTAGDNWLRGENNDQFTLQLMVLTDSEAKEKLIKILGKKEHQKESEEFIILKKPTTPPTYLLFYGEYPTLSAASLARNNLSPSLQKYAPFPVSVKQAIKKTQ